MRGRWFLALGIAVWLACQACIAVVTARAGREVLVKQQAAQARAQALLLGEDAR